MEEVLKYPLTPFPLSLSHVDGSVQKTSKAAFLKHVELHVPTTSHAPINMTIIDASYFLHLQMNFALPSTFAGVSHFFLQRVLLGIII